jgi:hypothetical protein
MPNQYYADFTLGDDGNAGTIGSPWKYAIGMTGYTGSGSLAAGDSMLLKRGETWRAVETVPLSGSTGLQITFGNYGSGALPIINGGTLVSSWTQGTATLSLGAGTNDAVDTNPMGTNVDTNYDVGFGTNNRAWLYKSGAGVLGYLLLRWNISALAGKTITGGTLSLYVDATSGAPLTNTLYSLGNTPGTTWGDTTATYNHYDGAGGHDWTGGHDGGWGDKGSQLSDNTTVPAAGNWLNFAFNAAGISYIDAQKAGSVNFLISMTAVQAGNNEIVIPTAHYVINSALRPKISITYLDPAFTTYTATAGSQVTSLFYDGSRLAQDTVTPTAPAANKWGWASNVLYLNKGDPTGHVIETITNASFNDGVVIGSTTPANAKDYITINGLEIVYVKRWSVNAINTNYAVVQNCTIHHSGLGDGGNDPVGIGLNHNATYAQILNNTIDDISDSPNSTTGSSIYIGTVYFESTKYSSHDHLIQGNTLSNSKDGISCKYGSISNMFQNNVIHDMADTGFRIVGDDSAGNTIQYNYIYNCPEAGISTMNRQHIYYNIINDCSVGIYVNPQTGADENSFTAGSNHLIYNNVIYGGDEGLKFGNTDGTHTALSNTVKNNIFSSQSAWGVRFSRASVDPDPPQNTFDYNLYYRVAGAQFYFDAAAQTLADWKTKCAGDSHAVSADPVFVSTTTPDFHLQFSSPCINTGVNVGLTQDYEGNPVPYMGIPDIGAYEYRAATMSIKRIIQCG